MQTENQNSLSPVFETRGKLEIHVTVGILKFQSKRIIHKPAVLVAIRSRQQREQSIGHGTRLQQALLLSQVIIFLFLWSFSLTLDQHDAGSILFVFLRRAWNTQCGVRVILHSFFDVCECLLAAHPIRLLFFCCLSHSHSRSCPWHDIFHFIPSFSFPARVYELFILTFQLSRTVLL